MRKLLSLLLIMLLSVICFCGCRGGEADSGQGTLSDSASQTADSTDLQSEPSRPEKVTKIYSFDCSFTVSNPKKDVFYDEQNGNSLPYCLYLPQNYSAAKKYPVILFLHGAGELGSDNVKQLGNIGKMFTHCSDFVSQAILICPQTAEWWRLDRQYEGDQKGTLGSALHLLQKIQKTYSCDNNRIYVTGLSMGGHATWELLEHYGNIFAAGVPLCGFGNTGNGAAFKDIPIRIYHGTADTTVSYSSSQEMYNSIIAAGGKRVELFPLYGVYHDAWNYAYADRDMFSWLFAQNKAKNPSGKYEYIPNFKIVDSKGKTVISDSDVRFAHFSIDWEDEGANADVDIYLTDEGVQKLNKAYTSGQNGNFTVYCATQKIYSFTASTPIPDDAFSIIGVFSEENYFGFVQAIRSGLN